jgi:hypothetical protein
MQMLVAGGLDALNDGVRAPDQHNPRGYFELEAVKATRRDSSWVREAPGRAVKVIHALVSALPETYAYRLILIERDLKEVIASQESMLGGAAPDALPAARLAEIFQAQLSELRSWSAARDVPLLAIAHADVLRAPEATASAVRNFLDLDLDVAAMVTVVAPELHRQRAP